MKRVIILLYVLQLSLVGFGQNNSLSFDGIDDYAELPAPASFLNSNVFTIELWYKPTGATSHEQTLLSRGSGADFWEINSYGA